MTDAPDPDRAAGTDAEGEREDDRNVLEEGSPVPDPEADDTGAEDIPEAD